MLTTLLHQGIGIVTYSDTYLCNSNYVAKQKVVGIGGKGRGSGGLFPLLPAVFPHAQGNRHKADPWIDAFP